MTILGKLTNLQLAYDEQTILENVQAIIPKGARIAVIGRNGAGKTSLLEAIAANDSSIQWMGRLPQIMYMQQEIKGISQAGTTIASRKLKSQWHVPQNHIKLSGVEKMKLRLADAFAALAELLLLDEPTNHLDAASVGLLIEQMNAYEGTVLFVSHDRYFIDETATHVWELEARQLRIYEGNYSASRQEKEHRRLTQQRKYDRQQAKVAMVENQIAELQSWSGKAHAESTKKDGYKEYYRMKAKKKEVQIRSKRKRLEAELEEGKIEKPYKEPEIFFEIRGNEKKGKRVLELNNISKRLGDRTLFSDVSFTVQHGERIRLVGPNGSGKTTLFDMINGRTEYEGKVWKTSGMQIGFLSQDVFDLPENRTSAELFGRENFAEEGEARTLMNHLGFGKTHWQQPVQQLSMGERVKLKMMEFMLSGCDVLLLDEPTNHLDLPSREQLEKTLQSFPGTLLIATHDRYFMEKLADKLLVFEEGRLLKYEGNYRDWTTKDERKETPDLLQLETELQAVLGKLSFLNPGDEEYRKLDEQFNELMKRIRAAKTTDE
ncbi:ribosomal protection-like ABC-F family protein [Planococcus lenghuensis]|uniref:ABC transporter domain-containing protein n=1 Tax=Planococcus lenghuensis TaxID=2213202 RepID=A0A1Q2KV47_9BACL|nr:ABC-F family ATP-binding cassette domain-containing protein [Planococcus lenghuensis]AQQ52071.1 hypothetical protein B0X71_02325 [Planococcus lenghuensis]